MFTIKKKILIIFCVSISAITLVYILYASSVQPNKDNNGFLRKYIVDPAIPLDTLEGLNTYGVISGMCKTAIFVESVQEKRMLWKIDWLLKKKEKLFFNLPDSFQILSRVHYQVDSPLINIFAGNGPDVFRTTLDDPTSLTRLHYPYSIFQNAYALPNGDYLFRGFENVSNSNEPIFIIWDPVKNVKIKKYNLFPPSTDAGIGTDGTMSYDTNSRQLIFIQRYKNGIFLIDSNFREKGKIETIDTVVAGSTRGGSYSENNDVAYSNATPQIIVNFFSCFDKGRIYINSSLRADNENEHAYSSYAAIDVYDLKIRRYLYSFKIPNFYGKKPIAFRVFENAAVVSYPNGMVTYQLRLPG